MTDRTADIARLMDERAAIDGKLRELGVEPGGVTVSDAPDRIWIGLIRIEITRLFLGTKRMP